MDLVILLTFYIEITRTSHCSFLEKSQKRASFTSESTSNAMNNEESLNAWRSVRSFFLFKEEKGGNRGKEQKRADIP